MSDWFAVINFNLMGPGSAFYNDYTNAEVEVNTLVKTVEETDSEFIKRCLGLCGSDCNFVQVNRYHYTQNPFPTTECYYYVGSFTNFDMDWSDNEIQFSHYDLYDHSGKFPEYFSQ